MVLSDDLIQEFAKLANEPNRNTSTDKMMYGTVVDYDNSKWVRIDGSDLLTPISSVTNVSNGDRVIVGIQNHSAIVNGNLTSPSTTRENVEDISTIVAEKLVANEVAAEFAKINIILSDYVKTDTLEAEYIDADTIESLYVKTEMLESDYIKADTIASIYVTTERLESEFATIDNLDATNIEVNSIKGTHAAFEIATINNFAAVNAEIDSLKVDKADIAELDAIKASIGVLDADVADINTLMFGSASGTTIQMSFANAVIAQLGDAQIKSAMIESVSAGKITAGDIITNNVRVMSEDGSLIISDETIQISDDARVRVQIGKDTSGDYSINIWDADGNLMFSEGGITDSAIKDAIIRNDMVSANANISASKLDIDSLFTEINNSSKTIKSTKIYLDDEEQTLDVAFTSMVTEVNGLSNDVSSLGTQFSVVQGQITSKIWQQDIDTAKNELDGDINTLSTKYSTLEQNLNGFQSTVSSTYVTKNDFNDLEVGGRNLLLGTASADGWSQYTSFDPEIREFTKSNSTIAENSFYCNNWFDLEAGQVYTLSFKAKQNGHLKNDANDIYILPASWGSTGIAYNPKITGLTTEYKDYTFTFTPSVNAASLENCQLRFDNDGSSATGTEAILYIKDIKLEKGSKATDWTPAPEDMATAKQHADLSTRVSQTESGISAVAERTTDNEAKITELELTADGLIVSVDNAAKTATSFMSYDATNGLLVGNKSSGSWSGSRAQITSSAFNILNSSGNKMASFGTTTIVGQSSGRNVYIDSDSVDIRSGSTVLASFGTDSIDLGLFNGTSIINLCGVGVIRAAEYAAGDGMNCLYVTAPKLYMESVDSVTMQATSATTTAYGRSYVGQHESYGEYGHSILCSRIDEKVASVNTTAYGVDPYCDVVLSAMNRGRGSQIVLTPNQGITISSETYIECTKTKIDGTLHVYNGTATFDGALVANASATFNQGLELYHATPYIDFHFNKSSTDYTSRIIESSSGVLTITGGLKVNGKITAMTQVLSAASARGSASSMSIPASTVTQLTLDTWIVRNDTDFTFSGGGIKCPRAGNVMVSGNVYFNPTTGVADGHRGVYIKKNDTEVVSSFLQLNTGSFSMSSGVAIIPVAAGDVIKLCARCTIANAVMPSNGSTMLNVAYV